MRIIIALLAILFLACTPLVAEAKGKHVRQQPEPQLIPAVPPLVATFDVYVGGIHFITADIAFQEQASKYRARVVGHTYGFWYKLFPWDTELLAEGRIRKDQFVPAEFSTHDQFGQKKRSTKLHFTKDGDVKAEFDPKPNADDHEPITFEQRRGSLDPVTALLQMLAHLAVEHDCNVTVPVFDGKLRFDITSAEVGREDIDEDEYSIFKGSARTCDANFNLVAGEWKDKVKSRFWYKNDKERGRETFHIWLARLREDLPELPVKLESGSVWGLVVIHLSNWRTGDSDVFKP